MNHQSDEFLFLTNYMSCDCRLLALLMLLVSLWSINMNDTICTAIQTIMKKTILVTYSDRAMNSNCRYKKNSLPFSVRTQNPFFSCIIFFCSQDSTKWMSSTLLYCMYYWFSLPPSQAPCSPTICTQIVKITIHWAITVIQFKLLLY